MVELEYEQLSGTIANCLMLCGRGIIGIEAIKQDLSFAIDDGLTVRFGGI